MRCGKLLLVMSSIDAPSSSSYSNARSRTTSGTACSSLGRGPLTCCRRASLRFSRRSRRNKAEDVLEFPLEESDEVVSSEEDDPPLSSKLVSEVSAPLTELDVEEVEKVRIRFDDSDTLLLAVEEEDDV